MATVKTEKISERITLRDSAEIRRRRAVHEANVARANARLSETRGRQRELIARMAAGGHHPHQFSSPASAVAALEGEVAAAQAEVSAQQAALEIIDGELATFEVRKKQADAQKREWKRLHKERLAELDRLEALFRDEICPSLDRLFQIDDRMASAIHAQDIEAGKGELKARLSRFVWEYFAEYCDGLTITDLTGSNPFSGTFADRPAWSTQESAFVHPGQIEFLG